MVSLLRRWWVVGSTLFLALWNCRLPGIPKLLKDVVKASEKSLFRSITEGKVSDTRTSQQAWLGYDTQELKDLLNFTDQALGQRRWESGSQTSLYFDLVL